MPDQPTTTANPSSAPIQPDDWQMSVAAMPPPAREWLFSAAAADNTRTIAKRYQLDQELTSYLAYLTGQVMIKKLALVDLPRALAEELDIDEKTAQQMAVDTAIKQFVPIKDWLTGTENFIVRFGGTIPKTAPPLAPAPPPSAAALAPTPPPAKPQPLPPLVFRPFREVAKENNDILNQLLTSSSIRLTDREQFVRPSIKNWLADYLKQKGARRHDEMERSDFLFKSLNAKDLLEDERTKLSAILKAYDENTNVPVITETNLIDLDKLAAQPEKPLPGAPTPPPAAPPAPRPPLVRTGPDPYREPVGPDDTGQAPAKPSPQINGNVIDLTSFRT